MRSILFTVSTDGTVTPTAPQYAGVQGEHQATVVRFALPEALQGDGYGHRVEYVDGMGAFDTTALLPIADGAVSVALPAAWTAAGGQAVVRLVISRLADGEEQQTCYTVDAPVFFRSRAQGGCQIEQTMQHGLSELIDRTETAAEHAEETARELTEAKERGEFQGEKGERGEQGVPGSPGEPGKDGAESVQYTAFTNNDSGVYYITLSPAVTYQSWQDFHPGTAFLVEFRKPIRENGGLLIDFVGNPSGGVTLTWDGRTTGSVLPAGWYLVLWDGTRCRIQSREGELAGSSGIIPYGEVTVYTEMAYSSANMQPALRYWGDGMMICLRLDADVYAGLWMMCANGDFHFAGDYAAGTHLMRVQGDQLVSLGRFPGGETEELAGELAALREETRVYEAALLTSAVSGTAITIDDAAVAPLRRAVVTGDTTESGSGDRSPDNPYTLTGAQPTTVTVAGEGGAATDYALPPLGSLYGRAAVRDDYDVLTGAATRRWARLELDGTEEWRGPASNYAAYTYNWDAPGSGIGYQTSVCSHFVNVNGAFIAGTGAPGKYCDHPNSGRKYFVSDKPTLEEFRAWLAAQHAAGTPVTIVYQLAEPVTETVGSPVSLSIPAPACTISADAGGMEVTYVQDSNIVIGKMQAAIEALSVKEVHT